MRLSKIYFSILVTLLFVAPSCVRSIVCNNKEEKNLLVIHLDSIKLHKEENIETIHPLFSFHDYDGPVFGLSWIEEEFLSCENNHNNTYVFGVIPFLTPISDSIFVLDFNYSDDEMAKRMGLYTDDISTHDCLFRLVLMREFTYLPKQTGSFWADCKNRLNAVIDNSITRFQLHKGNVIDNPFSVHIKKNKNRQAISSFAYAYYDYESQQIYLINKLPKEEGLWGLYYYPSLLVGQEIIRHPSFMPICVSDDGCLYIIEEPLSFYEEQYVYVEKYGSFVRIVGDIGQKDFASLIKSYFVDTERMNITIRIFFEQEQDLNLISVIQ